MIFIILCLKDTKFLINVCFQYQFFKKNLDKVPDVAQQDLVAFLEPGTQVGSRDTGWIPGPAQWVKSLALPQLWPRQLRLGSDPQLRDYLCLG